MNCLSFRTGNTQSLYGGIEMIGKRTKRITWGTVLFFLSLVSFVLMQTACFSSFGGDPSGKRLERIRSSPQYKGDHFENEPFVPNVREGQYTEILKRQLFGDEIRNPPKPIPVSKPEFSPLVSEKGLRASWFGHSTVLVEIDGIRILTDPVFSDRVSPFTSLGPKRFFPSPTSLEELPKIDAVLISHDHYDHLDMDTARYLTGKGTVYFVPLGVGAHLEAWNIPESQIVELDWWEKKNIKNISIVCTPAVHYSGRGLFNRKSTLWSSWSVLGPTHRFFHSGDTGYSKHFREIGDRLGPFDLTSIKVGAYDWTWDGIHMMPEHGVQAHLDLKGKKMLPVHWGTFNLAIHAWDEPILRTIRGAEENRVDLATPKPGEWVDFASRPVFEKWWEKIND